ncbi:dipeptidase [Kurthia sp. FSL E2-0154]|uniref:dipeptidase n=1 Tax=Kurthia sp. FSL E2-0154 TaxID=2921358 RepID=UPI0030FC8620
MEIIDLHCDVLYTLSQAEAPISFKNNEKLEVTLEQLKKTNTKLQVFAIFIDDTLNENQRYLEAIRQVEIFHQEIITPYEEMVHITDWKQLQQLQPNQIGAVLSLEGCDAIGSDLRKLQTFIDAGILLCGLTWNHENAVAYGAEENPAMGIKPFGREVIALLNAHHIIIDVSHLNEQGFWDTLQEAKYVIASHSNARAIQDHPRNLYDQQLRAVAEKGGHVHCVFYPPFISNEASVTIDDLVKHIKHLAKIITPSRVGLGSDFEGIDLYVENLTRTEEIPNLLQALEGIFTTEEIKGIAAENFQHFISKIERS